MKKRTFVFLFGLAILLNSCFKDNQEAKKLDGSWKLTKWEWARKDSIPAKTLTDSLGTWQFAACKSRTETCRGTITNFFDTTNVSKGFGWYIRSKGKKFTFGADDIKSTAAQFGGDWDVIELSENNFIISGETCGSCRVLGKETLTFSK